MTAAERTARNPKRRYLHTSVNSLYGRQRGVGTGIAVEALHEGWAKRRSTGGELLAMAKVRRVHHVIRAYLDSVL